MKILQVTEKQFYRLRYDYDLLEAEVVYEVNDPKNSEARSWGYSPDGIGVYWYETLEDLQANH